MNKNVLIVLAGGFLIAILVAVLVQASLGGKKKDDQRASNKVYILVAAKDLAMGKEIGDGDVKWQAWPEDSVFAGAIVREGEKTAKEAIKGRMLQAVAAGQPIHPGAVTGAGKNNFVAASLKEGMRAVAIPVKAHMMVGGFVGPGDYVDVLVTYKIKVRDRSNLALQALVNQYATETVLENVRVLAADQTAIREDDEAEVAKTVTLEVSSEQAEHLAVADAMGEMKLSLRGVGDEEKNRGKDATTDVGASRVLQDMVKVQAGGSRGGMGVGGTIRVYNGQNVMNMPVPARRSNRE